MTPTDDRFTATMQHLGSPDELAARAVPPGRLLAPTPTSTCRPTSPPLRPRGRPWTWPTRRTSGSSARATTTITRSTPNSPPGRGRRGIFPLFGLEIICLIDDLVQDGVKINDPGNPGKMYICGKGITRFHPLTGEAAGLLQTIRDNDGARMAAVTDKLSGGVRGRRPGHGAGRRGRQGAHRRPPRLAAGDGLLAGAARRPGVPGGAVRAHPRGRPPAAFLERAYGVPPKAAPDDAVATQNEIRSQLLKAGKPAYVPETFVDFDHAYRLILALGGIPCYPTLADGVRRSRSTKTPWSDWSPI